MRLFLCAVLTLFVSTLASAVGSIPMDPDARDGAEHARELGDHLFAEAVRGYEASDSADPRWDDLYKKAMRLGSARAASRLYSFVDDGAEAHRAQDAAYDAGCRDPLLLYTRFYSRVITPDADRAELLDLLRVAADAASAPRYPALERFLVHDVFAAYTRDVDDPERAQAITRDAFKALRRAALRGDIPIDTPAQQRRVFYIADQRINLNAPPEYTRDLYRSLRSIKGIDAWTRRMLDAVNEINLAWRARGARLADETSDAQFRNFHRRLRAARTHLVEAHRMHPERPEAAALLITITNGLGEAATKDIHYWFEQAVAAEIDWVKAYENYDWALRPRWGGSHEEMLALGEAAWETQRFDTFVPLVRIWMITQIARDTESKRETWQAPGRRDLAVEVIDAVIDRPEWSKRQNYLQTLRASVGYWSGDWDLFKDAWAKLERRDGKAYFEGDALVFMAMEDRFLRYSANHFKLPE